MFRASSNLQVTLMFHSSKFFRRSLTAAALLALTGGFGCQQLARSVRSEPISEAGPIPPSPELQPVPETSSPLPLLPPPAPPSDAALRGPLPVDEEFWSESDRAVANHEATEFFPETTLSLPPAFSRQRGEEVASRLADDGRIAAARREWERQHLLPIIVPASPRLMRVSAEELSLLPVPTRK